MSERRDGPAELEFRAVDEAQPDAKWRALFDAFQPLYERWFLCQGDAARPSYAESARKLREHVPELVPTYERLVDLAGGGDRVARLLSLYRPAPFLAARSQAIWSRGAEAALVRNYDYAPDLCDGVLLRSAWTGPRVIAMTDCLWGVLDGMNEHGLAAALAFGGRKVVGEGFGITLILRYVLETCESAAAAVRVLERVPSHMAYIVALVDARGDFATAYVAPDRPTKVQRAAASTNHQDAIEWREHARATETVERRRFLQKRLADPAETLEALVGRFLVPPLYRTAWSAARGTLYTAVYGAQSGTVELRWPDHAWRRSFERFEEGVHVARYAEGAGCPRPATA